MKRISGFLVSPIGGDETQDTLVSSIGAIDTLSNSNKNVKYKIIKKWVNDEINKLVNYAYDLWWIDFVLTLEAENWLWKWDRRSMIIWANWHWDYGLCQLNYQWHKPFIDSEEFKDPYKQLDYCNWVFQDWIKRWIIRTTFYWYNNRHKVKNNFIIN